MSGLSTTSNAEVKDNRQKIADLRKKHQPVFDALGVSDAIFIPKLAYRPKAEGNVQLEDMHLAFFPGELNKGKDIYTEFANFDYEPQDPERALYRWRFNPHWETEYPKTEKHPQSGYRYLIPVSELIKIEHDASKGATSFALDDETQLAKDFDIPDPDTDLPLSQCTIRDLYAVLHNKPVSTKKWLNDIINPSKPK